MPEDSRKPDRRRRSLRQRLDEMVQPKPTLPKRKSLDEATRSRLERIEGLRQLVAGVRPRPADPSPPPVTQEEILVEDVVAGQFEDTPHGPVFVATTEIQIQSRHGGGPRFEELCREIPHRLARLARAEELEGRRLDRFAYFDTETTGLATAAGTYIFLAGIGFVDGPMFRVEQIFMRDFAEELGCLWLLTEKLATFEGVVTYNGRAYDLPLLQARYVTNRVFEPPIPRNHLDLLAPARRLWRARGVGCRIVQLEPELLDIHRVDDVPGDLIPRLYFDSIYQRNAALLKQVFYHNGVDILSLAALTALAAHLLADPPPEPAEWSGEDLYSLARIRELLGEPGVADAFLQSLQRGFRSSQLNEEAMARCGLALRRGGRWPEAEQILQTLAGAEGPFRSYALIELAKRQEHHDRNLEEAAALTRRVLDMEGGDLPGRIPPPSEFKIRPEAAAHRLARLETRLQGLPWRPGSDSTGDSAGSTGVIGSQP